MALNSSGAQPVMATVTVQLGFGPPPKEPHNVTVSLYTTNSMPPGSNLAYQAPQVVLWEPNSRSPLVVTFTATIDPTSKPGFVNVASTASADNPQTMTVGGPKDNVVKITIN